MWRRLITESDRFRDIEFKLHEEENGDVRIYIYLEGKEVKNNLVNELTTHEKEVLYTFFNNARTAIAIDGNVYQD